MTASIDHYAVLGVDSDAQREDIHRAWLAAARINHPDALGDVNEVERRAAARRMHEINEAWRILGSLDLRASYDKTQQRNRDRSKPSLSEWTEEFSEMEASDPPGFEVGNPFVATALRALPRLVIGAIGIGIFVFSAFATNSRPERWTPVTEPPSDRCVVVRDDSVRSVDCERKSSRLVVDSFDIGSAGECPPETESVQARKLMEIYCLTAVEEDGDPS